MESIAILSTQDEVARDLHAATGRIRQVIQALVRSAPEDPCRVATPQQMSDLLSELMRAGQWLRGLPAERDRDLERELCEYRDEVERLRALLPAIQASLLAERARLEQERERLNGAAAWIRVSRQAARVG